VTATLPPNLAGKKWYRVADTAGWMENADNFNAAGSEELLTGASYSLASRSVLLLIEK
jgi:glycogen operon protein